jgi:dihydrofolate reductase
MRPYINIIVARSRNGVIGKDGKLPWYLPEDLKFFKEKTIGFPVIMGRKTWESIGKPLKGRENIVLTKNPSYQVNNAIKVSSLEEALALFTGDIFIIGGASLYREALPLANKVWITEIDKDFEGNAVFDKLDEKEWKLIWEEKHQSSLPFKFQCFERICPFKISEV